MVLSLFLTSPSLLPLKPTPPFHLHPLRICLPLRQRGPPPPSYKVTIEHEGSTRVLDVDPEESILERALDEGMSVPHDCKLGVCMTCPARLVSGVVDQSDGMLSDDVVDKGYALLCASYPRSDCHIQVIPEEELLSLQLATAND